MATFIMAMQSVLMISQSATNKIEGLESQNNCLFSLQNALLKFKSPGG